MALRSGPDDSLLQKISAEVAPEVSPLLRFLLRHARLIAIFLGLALVVAVGFGVYSWHSGRRLEQARIELGRIEVSPDPAVRIRELEAFAGTAPSSMRAAVTLALAQASLEARDYGRAAGAWGTMAEDPNGSFYLVAVLGKAQALVMQDKSAEALAVLENAAPAISEAARSLVDRAIADLAEKTGNLERAIAAGESLAANSAIGSESEYWLQKIASLRQQKAAQTAR